jgi:ABC-2 type transport system permease protein
VDNTPKPIKYLQVLLKTDFLVLLKNTRILIISLATPLYILFITSRNTKSTLGSPIFLVVLAITIGLLSTSILGYALTVARDRERGIFQRLRVTPAPTWTIMASRLLVQVVANLVITVVVLGVGSNMHNVSLSVGEYLAVLLVSILGGAVFLSIGQALVGLVRSAILVNSIGGLLYAGLLLTGLLGPSGVLGSTFQNVSEWTPVGTIMTVFQGVVSQGVWNSQTWFSLLTCFGYIIVFTAIGIKWFRWDAR